MKLNKRIAAGALAFALVTPVVANAAEGTYIITKLPTTVVEKVTNDGKTLTKVQFQTALEEANKSYNEYLTAKEDARVKKAALDVAVERYNKAYEAYRNLFGKLTVTHENGAKLPAPKELKGILETEYQTNLDLAVAELASKLDDPTLSNNLTAAHVKYNNGVVTIKSIKDGRDLEEAIIKAADKNLLPGEIEQAIDRVKKAKRELIDLDSKVATLQEKYREYTVASYEKDRLKEEYDKAAAKEEKTRKKHEANMVTLTGFAHAFNVVVEATDKGITIVDKTPEVKEELSAEKLAKLQASIDKANDTLRAVEILEKLTPNTAANNRAKLNALVAEQKAAIAKAEALIKANKKVAFISTAYAAEATNEDVDALIEELDNNTAAIQEEMKKLDSEVKEEVKPAEKEEEKPAEKEEDKKDDKKEEKVVEKVVVKEKAANKKAGSNAKTGIAGVAGVAGVLAAASVAYAASKKNN